MSAVALDDEQGRLHRPQPERLAPVGARWLHHRRGTSALSGGPHVIQALPQFLQVGLEGILFDEKCADVMHLPQVWQSPAGEECVHGHGPVRRGIADDAHAGPTSTGMQPVQFDEQVTQRPVFQLWHAQFGHDPILRLSVNVSKRME
ncbi:hypothetical protein ABZU32_36135 [Sphaerisporangium sp. NPDC005288]|uniref:hypothetical protein n=1 Tax=Sphaerisporangium sp. NPDC005288 TaxID=3155114 RepID=UPI00339F457D